ncbi:AbrB/MazE/SpoVT family DNA-binding domain-containing protein [Candidatus Woesearchaeota archaeon]|nr:AbrB/MazE/SpoVT family DNA-binding domain-containing protein [Candidatus Woesearchaeota archaeon]
MATKMKEGAIYCAKCDSEMKLALLPSYEYLEGHALSNVPAYECPKCGNVFFSGEQAARMKQRTNALIESTFGFHRKITVTGRSLAVTIPQELASHMNLSKGVTVKIIPSTGGLMIRKVKAL